MRPFSHPLRSIRRAPLTVWLLAGALLAPVAMASRDVERTISASPNASIEIENTAGSVRVRGWDQAQVRVSGTIGDDVEELVVEGGGGQILIEVEVPDRGGWRNRDIDARLEVWVPRESRLEIETVSASIEVDDFGGQLEAESVSGSIEVSGSPSLVDAESVSGGIRLEGVDTSATAETVSGSIRLRGVSKRVEASTVSGSIDVDAGEIERGEFETVSGTVDIRCTLARGARLDASSHSGNVTIELPASVSASFEASTFSGRIENDFGAQARSESKWVPSKSLEFSNGGGSAEVTLETFSGSVRIRKR